MLPKHCYCVYHPYSSRLCEQYCRKDQWKKRKDCKFWDSEKPCIGRGERTSGSDRFVSAPWCHPQELSTAPIPSRPSRVSRWYYEISTSFMALVHRCPYSHQYTPMILCTLRVNLRMPTREERPPADSHAIGGESRHILRHKTSEI